MKHVVNFSGGRTSAYLATLMIDKFGRENCEFIFCDTGAEHPKTYEFIRECNEKFRLNLTCIRAIINPEIGKGVTSEVKLIGEIGYDLSVWREMLAKHGTPFNPGGGFCTDRLKTSALDHYCDTKYGKGNYYRWLGFRVDESRRAWGSKNYPILTKLGFDSYSAAELMIQCQRGDHEEIINNAANATKDMFDGNNNDADQLIKKLKVIKKNFRFMFELTDFEKQDVIHWWSQNSFDLKIAEHLGNCVFCIKKGSNKVALAARDEPEMAQDFINLVDEPTVRDMHRKSEKEVMYRGHNSLKSIIESHKGFSREEIEQTIRGMRRYESGSCSESCEAFGDLLDNE